MMKRVLIGLLLAITLGSNAWADDCSVGDGADPAGDLETVVANADCERIIVTSDITLTSSMVVNIAAGVEIYGEVGTEKVSGEVAGPLFGLLTDNTIIHDLVLENTSDNESAQSIMIPHGTSGHELYDLEFQNCEHACISVAGSGVGSFYQNTFTDTEASAAIVYVIGDFDPASFSSASMASYSAWSISLTTPESSTGNVELYLSSNGDLTPISLSEDQTGTEATSIDFTTQLPSGTFYALFTENSTSPFETSFEIDWSDDTNFTWGDYSACDTAWFLSSVSGQGTGDYDGDGLTNAEEDADNDCTVDDTETSPVLADTDEDGYCDSSTAVDNDSGTCEASDNCPLVANATQADDDEDGEGDACDDDYTENSAPVAPSLVSPADGATGLDTSVTLKWNATTDPDDDTLSYQAFVCDDETFTGCEAVYDSSVNIAKAFPVSASGLGLIFGALALGGIVSRRKKIVFLIAFSIFAASALVSCGGGGGGGATSTVLSYTAEDLEPSTTYYWKIQATDTSSNATPSSTRSFTTE